MNERNRQKLLSARIVAASVMPYFSASLFTLRFVEREMSMPTMAVDDAYRCYCDPRFVGKHGVDVLATCLLHEVQHLIRAHFQRVGDRDPLGYNLANDCEVNDDLLEMGLPFIDNPITPKLYKLPNGKTAEWYYDQIMEQREKEEAKRGRKGSQGGTPQSGSASQEAGEHSDEDQDGSGVGGESDDGNGSGGMDQRLDRVSNGGGGSPPGTGARNRSGKDARSDAQPDDGAGSDGAGDDAEQQHDGRPLAGRCGGCAGNPEEFEDREGDPEPIPQTERELIRYAVAAAINEAVRGRGKVPGGLRAWAEAMFTPPKVAWERVLSAQIRSAFGVASGYTDFTRTRISRRAAGMMKMFGARAPVLAAMYKPQPQVDVIVDTSGSMTGTPMENAFGQTIEIVKTLGCPVKVWAVDADVQAVKVISSREDVKDMFVGFGGTDMRVGIDAAAKGNRTGLVIVLTDGYTPWPEPNQMPSATLVAAVIGDEEVPSHIRRVVRVPRE